MSKIPLVPATGPQAIVSTLGGVRFRFRFRYNPRTVSWYCHIETAAGEVVHTGIRLVNLHRHLRSYRHRTTSYPDGDLMVLDMTGGVDAPSKLQLGNDYLILFIDSADEEDFFGLLL